MNKATTNGQQDFTIPKMLPIADPMDHIDVMLAHDEHDKNLTKAQHCIADALSMLTTLRRSLELVDDDAGAITMLDAIEKPLRKAESSIDRQQLKNANLFLAYFDLKAGGAA